jgi:hypothetical protein
MKRIALIGMLSGILLLTGALPAMAAENGYCYIVAYSWRQKVAFITPVFMQKVEGKSYSSTEFCADVELIQKMESHFQKYIQETLGLSIADLTVSARAAYKSKEIAESRREKEKKDFSTRVIEIEEITDYHFS